jgi:hypothetical protein
MHPPENLIADPESTGAPQAVERGFIRHLRNDYVIVGLFLVALLINAALFGFLVVRFNSLPDPLPLHFDGSGLPDRIEVKNGVVALPVIGLIVFVLNTVLGILVYRRERAATVLLVMGTLFVQVLMWLATINVAGGLYEIVARFLRITGRGTDLLVVVRGPPSRSARRRRASRRRTLMVVYEGLPRQ